MREKINAIRYGSQEALQALVPVIDDFTRVEKLYQEEPNEELFPEGIRLIYQKMINALSELGMTEMEPMASYSIRSFMRRYPKYLWKMKNKTVESSTL